MLIGHEKIWSFLEQAFEQKKIPHAFLFAGGNKLGKRTLAFELAKKVLKEDVSHFQHPDFIFLGPGAEDSFSEEEKEKKKKKSLKSEIPISKIRELIWKFSLTPSLSPFKIAVIDEAHLMNLEAQNCLLKTLEEPKGNSVLFLVSEYPELLLTTLRSRCSLIKFYPVEKEKIKRYLREKKIEEKMSQAIVELSQGRPGLAVDFSNNPQRLQERAEIEKELVKILKADLETRFRWAQKRSENLDFLKEILNSWLLLLRKNLVLKIRKKKEKEEIRKEIKRIRELEKIRFLLFFTNINPRLALENLMLSF